MPEVNPHILRWALDWNKIDADELATTSGYEQLPKWLSGERQPTIKQLEKFAKKTNTLVPYFFMDSIPSLNLQIPEFRTRKGLAPIQPSPELFDTIDDLLYRQGWMRAYFEDAGYEPLELIGKFSLDIADVFEVANYLHDLLGLGDLWARQGTYDKALKKLRETIENKRVSVSISGYARSATNRSFDASEFQGFVLSDPYAPIVFINGKDSKAAQIFTLIHELVHLLFSQTGLINAEDELTKSDIETEEKCNRITAEFLAPSGKFVELWENNRDEADAIDNACKTFKISHTTATRRALELNLISKDHFWDLYNQHKAAMKDLQTEQDQMPKKRSRGDSYNNIGVKLGMVFTDAIYTALKSNYVLYSEAYNLTGLKGKTFDTYFARKGYIL